MQKLLLRFYNALLATETFILVSLLFLAIVIACSQIVLRNFFDSGIYWADSSLRIMVLWIAMIGAMFASRNKKHIRIDLLSHYLSFKMRTNIWRLTEFVTAIICGVVAYYSIEFIQAEYEDGLIAFANVPVWLCGIIIPITFTIMSLRYLVFSLLPSHLLAPDPSIANPPSEFID